MDLKIKENPVLNKDSIVKMIFTSYNETSKNCEPYGSMIWNGSEWIIDVDTKNETLSRFHSTNVLATRVLTLNDYDLYVPLVNTQSKSMYVRGLTKQFCEDNNELISKNPLLVDENGFLIKFGN